MVVVNVVVGVDEWFETFFDRLYYETYRPFETEDRNEKEARFIVDALGLPHGSTVLDLGCGYARHAVYLAKWGFRVVCYDLSKFMLERARERVEEFGVAGRVELVRGDMRRLEYDSYFDGAYIFFTAFGYFSDRENMLVLERVSRALKPGGTLLIDLLNPVRVMYEAHLYRGVKRVWSEAGDYVELEEAVFDVRRARINVRRKYYRRADGGLVDERSFTLRIYTYWELREMLEKAGMRLEKAYGSYKGDEYEPESPRLIVVTHKAE